MSELDYAGSHVVVTGGASGVGAALLDLLAELGAGDVTVLDRVPPTGAHATYLEVDLADEAAVAAAVERIDTPVDVLFDNAGVADTQPPETVFRVNVLAVRQVATALLPAIPDGGAVVITSSIAGTGWPAHLEEIKELLAIDGWDDALAWYAAQDLDVAPYLFSKEVAQVLTMHLSHLARDRGVRVNSVCPAPVDTPLLTDFRATMTDELIDWTLANAVGRAATPREVAWCLAWLGSPASSYVNGVNLLVDGGFGASLTLGHDRTAGV